MDALGEAEERMWAAKVLGRASNDPLDATRKLSAEETVWTLAYAQLCVWTGAHGRLDALLASACDDAVAEKNAIVGGDSHDSGSKHGPNESLIRFGLLPCIAPRISSRLEEFISESLEAQPDRADSNPSSAPLLSLDDDLLLGSSATSNSTPALSKALATSPEEVIASRIATKLVDILNRRVD